MTCSGYPECAAPPISPDDLSVVSGRFSVFSCPLSVVPCHLSFVCCLLSVRSPLRLWVKFWAGGDLTPDSWVYVLRRKYVCIMPLLLRSTPGGVNGKKDACRLPLPPRSSPGVRRWDRASGQRPGWLRSGESSGDLRSLPGRGRETRADRRSPWLRSIGARSNLAESARLARNPALDPRQRTKDQGPRTIPPGTLPLQRTKDQGPRTIPPGFGRARSNRAKSPASPAFALFRDNGQRTRDQGRFRNGFGRCAETRREIASRRIWPSSATSADRPGPIPPGSVTGNSQLRSGQLRAVNWQLRSVQRPAPRGPRNRHLTSERSSPTTDN